MKIFGVAVNVRSFVNTSMKQSNTELTASNLRLGNVKIRLEYFKVIVCLHFYLYW